ncbi:MAG: 3-deoxy-8-phosphooctulonate synthase [Alphaproteobacteria bacterium]
MTTHSFSVGTARFANDAPLAIIAGPCAIESRQHALETAHALKEIAEGLKLSLVYKSSYDKANRTASSSHRGIGMGEGLPILAAVREETGLPVLTDVHEASHCRDVAEVVDILQIPAFLCRQTDLLVAAACAAEAYGGAVNVKKGQFLAPWDMRNVAEKLEGAGATRILLTERGVSFGYNALVSDMRGLPVLAQSGWPVVFDCTHSVQQPGGRGTRSGGQREFAPVLARAAVAVGVAAVFMETHADPDNAPSDGPNMIYLEDLRGILSTLQELDTIAKASPVEIGG